LAKHIYICGNKIETILKNFTLIAKITTVFMLFSLFSLGQKVNPTLHRCYTDEALRAYFDANPGAKAQYEANQAVLEQNLQNRNGQRVALLNVKIPVVVHVVGANPNLVTLAQIERQIQLMNLDFAGTNPDSTNNNPAWASRRGHSGIQFVLAKRDPSGACTDGVTRTVSTVAAFGTGNTIKRTASGGKDGWPITGTSAYLNMWVGPIGGGILGYATFPGTGVAADQGVVVDPQYFGEASSACGVDATYGKGRTLTHEVGHFFNLFHTFQGGCSGTGDNIAETPAHSNPTFNCPTGVLATNLCAGEPNPPGVQYQNYMDYTDDACMTMFVNQQVARMEASFTSADRAALLTSDGATPLGANDAAWFRYTGTSNCAPLSGCASALATPVATFKNNGSANITSATIAVKVNGVTVQTFNFTGLVKPDTLSPAITFSPVTLTVSPSTVSLEILNVNGGADACTATNIYNQVYTANFSPIVNLPVLNTFEGGTIGTGWNNVVVAQGANTTATTVWDVPTATAAAPLGGYANSLRSARFVHYNPNMTGRTVDLRTPRINTAASTLPLVVKFDFAYALYTGFPETLTVLASTDCGATFTQIFTGSGAAISTLTSTANFLTPTAAQWRSFSIPVPAAIQAAGNVIFAFRTVSNWGNNMYIDNINIAPLAPRDITPTAINIAGATAAGVICSNTFTPSIVVNNPGTEAVTAFTVNYSVDGGTPISQNVVLPIGSPLLPNGNTTVTLPMSAPLTPGAHVVVAKTSNPVTVSGTGDLNTVNDSIVRNITVRRIYPAPLSNDFEAARTGTLTNPQPDYFLVTTGPATLENAFIKRPNGYFSDSCIYVENYLNDRRGFADAFQMPAIDVTGADSVYFEFDYSAAYFSAADADSLILQYSTNCGATFQWSNFKVAGPSLSTVGGPLTSAYFPTMPTNPAQWRRAVVRFGGANLANGNMLFRFLHIGDYGNNIFIDNINIRKVYKRDLRVVNFATPSQQACTGTLPVNITVTNAGIDTITGFTAAHQVNNGTPVVTVITGISLPAGATAVYPIGNATLPAVGAYTLTAYSYAPVTVSGNTDQFVANDTTRLPVTLTATVAAPLVENFDGTTFPPTGWAVVNPNLDAFTWRVNSTIGNSGKSAFLNNRNYVSNGRIDHLVSPNVTFPSTVDSVFFSFDLAAATYLYPGATLTRMDTLEVLYTKDCGVTFTSIWKKWGSDLQTVNDPNTPQTSEFLPIAPEYWRKEKINLTSLVSNSPLQFVFRNINNNGNNVFIDNVNLSTVTVPAKVKQNGYMVTPTVSNGTYTIRHYTAPIKLQSVEIYSSTGQLVYRKAYNGGAPVMLNVDITRFAAGIYELRMNYTDKKITERIIKQ
jgi:hypothetical protein